MFARDFKLGYTDVGTIGLKLGQRTYTGDAMTVYKQGYRTGPRTRAAVLGAIRDKVLRPHKGCLDWAPVLGTDPECFGTRGDAVIGAHEVLPKRGQMFWDGVQAEFKVQPTNCVEGLVARVGTRINGLAARYARKGATLVAESCVPLTPEFLAAAPPETLVFGCNPSMNAYDLRVPPAEPKLPWRFAGGHLHFGGVKWAPPWEYVEVLDQTVGLIGTALATRDRDVRRQHYGLAGEYRVPGAGRLEYRTLSNFWLWHPALMDLVFRVARGALTLAALGINDAFGFETHEVIRAINTTDAHMALGLLRRAQPQMETFLFNSGIEKPAETLVALERGVEPFVRGAEFIHNWDMDGLVTWNQLIA